jgi:hypothetical protein
MTTIEFSYGDDEWIDFEPLTAFESAADTTTWLRTWTNNPEINGDDLRVFGEDASGGCTAFWLVRQYQPLIDQPVVFFGSEGELGVIAPDLGGLLWLLADGLSPWDATNEPGLLGAARPHQELTAIAERFAAGRRQPPDDIVNQAATEFPNFVDLITGPRR